MNGFYGAKGFCFWRKRSGSGSGGGVSCAKRFWCANGIFFETTNLVGSRQNGVIIYFLCWCREESLAMIGILQERAWTTERKANMQENRESVTQAGPRSTANCSFPFDLQVPFLSNLKLLPPASPTGTCDKEPFWIWMMCIFGEFCFFIFATFAEGFLSVANSVDVWIKYLIASLSGPSPKGMQKHQDVGGFCSNWWHVIQT